MKLSRYLFTKLSCHLSSSPLAWAQYCFSVRVAIDSSCDGLLNMKERFVPWRYSGMKRSFFRWSYIRRMLNVRYIVWTILLHANIPKKFKTDSTNRIKRIAMKIKASIFPNPLLLRIAANKASTRPPIKMLSPQNPLIWNAKSTVKVRMINPIEIHPRFFLKKIPPFVC